MSVWQTELQALRLQPGDLVVVCSHDSALVEQVVAATDGKNPVLRVDRLGAVREARHQDYFEYFHHRVVDEGLFPINGTLGTPGKIVDQAAAVVGLLKKFQGIPVGGPPTLAARHPDLKDGEAFCERMPKKNCKRCFGRGVVGHNRITDVYEPCRCLHGTSWTKKLGHHVKVVEGRVVEVAAHVPAVSPG